jgi:hypothetical protein
MKFSLSALMFCLLMATLLSMGYGQERNGSNPLVRSCHLIFLQFGWMDGQAIPLTQVQHVINTMQLPEGYTMTPETENAVNVLANLDVSTVPQVVFHCITDNQQLASNTVAKFYFTYLLPNHQLMQTPEFVVEKN